MHQKLLDQNFLNDCLQKTLMEVNEEKSIELMKYWIASGADPELENNYILRKAAKSHKRKIIHYLIEDCNIHITYQTQDWLSKNCSKDIIIYIQEKFLKNSLNQLAIVEKNSIKKQKI
jgi:hypothetical protein